MIRLELRIRRYRLDYVLAVIKHPIQSDIKDIGVFQPKHLCLLELRHAPSRGEHKHPDTLAAPHCILRRGTRIPAGSTQDVQGFPAPCQLVLKKLPQQLHRHILKRGGGPFRQVGDKQPLLQFGDGHDLLVGKFRVGVRLLSDAGYLFFVDIVDE